MSGTVIPGESSSEIDVSIVIPTYNRKESLLSTLASLSQQTYPGERSEVVVVDDGSTDRTNEIMQCNCPFSLRYVRQENQGGASARNRGAEAAEGEVLIFLDDDMTPDPGYVSGLASRFSSGRRLLARGRLEPWVDQTSLFARLLAVQRDQTHASTGDFCSNNLAIRVDDFWTLGGWRDLLPDTSEHRGGIWSDLEFAVRASRNGFQLITVQDARIVHRDYASQTLDSACGRAYMVSRLAVPVVGRHPHLKQHMQMLHDKGPIAWRVDPPSLILRKLARQSVSSRPAMAVMENTVPVLERYAPSPTALRLLYRWVVSGYIYRGYREGLRHSQDEATA